MVWLAREGLERQPSQVWDSLALACLEMEALDVFPELRRAYEEGLVDPQFVGATELDAVEVGPRGRWLEGTRDGSPPIDRPGCCLALEAPLWELSGTISRTVSAAAPHRGNTHVIF